MLINNYNEIANYKKETFYKMILTRCSLCCAIVLTISIIQLFVKYYFNNLCTMITKKMKKMILFAIIKILTLHIYSAQRVNIICKIIESCDCTLNRLQINV